MKRARAFVILLFAFIFFTSCSPTPKRYNAVYADLFDTVTEFTAYCGSREEFDRYSEALHGELLRLHKIFDIYSSYEDTENAYTLNLNKKANNVPDELKTLIEDGVERYYETDGRLNIALGSVLSLWSDCRDKNTVPDIKELEDNFSHCRAEDIIIDGNGITLSDPKMSLDFGAVAKGYATEKGAELLKELGLERFAVSCGGNIVAGEEKPSGKWEIGIEDPEGGIYTTVKVANLSVVTSGDYQRYYEVSGVRYHHIIDPKTLFPADYWRSVTVISESSYCADFLSTALFCMDLEDGKKLAESFGAEVLWIKKDGSSERTDGFADYEK